MKIRHLLISSLVALAIISCSSKQNNKAEEQPDDKVSKTEQVTTPEPEVILEEGDINKPSHIVISKETMTLKLYDTDNRIIFNFPCAMGKNLGNKVREGDMKTPEGNFHISQIKNASAWSHDFKDGKGEIPHAYGDWFIRLETPPHRGIGIHGTHNPSSIGTRATEGCIRLHNENLNRLRPLVKVGMKVTIETSRRDLEADGRPTEDFTAPAAEPLTKIDDKSANNTKRVTPKDVAQQTPSTGAAADGEIINHTIASGEFLSHIAVKYHTTIDKIKELNPGLTENVRQGQTIRVQPNTDKVSIKKKSEDPNGVYHTIESGDSFTKLANQYNTTADKIVDLNPDVNPRALQIGQRIRVK